jgi:hypothetical protein
MRTYRHLTTALFTLAACEPADTSTIPPQPVQEQAKPAEPPPPAVAPVEKPVTKEAPKEAVKQPAKQPAIITPKAPTAYDYNRRCMSRAGCKWDEKPPAERVKKVEESK